MVTLSKLNARSIRVRGIIQTTTPIRARTRIDRNLLSRLPLRMIRQPNNPAWSPMQKLTLFYRGELKSNGDAKHKHAIRSVFHLQLERHFMDKHENLYEKVTGEVPEAQQNEDFIATHLNRVERAPHLFYPLALVGLVELDITMLRPGPMGQILAGGGDIDNRLKTLFDALQVPDANQSKVVSGSEKMHCLMADDKLVSRVNVRTSQLLDVPTESREVVVVIDVTLPDV